ncbi:hypothetical protein SprV_0301227900 [Sparganum proliferum]
MQKFGFPERFTRVVRQLHDGMMVCVKDNWTVSEAFTVTNRAKEGCVLAPTPFGPMFSVMLMDAYREEHPSIGIDYRTDGHILNSRRVCALTRLSTTTIHDLPFAGNYALNIAVDADMQRSMDSSPLTAPTSS